MSRSLPIAILYEDQLADPRPKNYGPHALVLACIADQFGISPHDQALKSRFNPITRKGVDKVIAACGDRRLGDAYLQVVAVCDRDRIHEHLGLDAASCKDVIRGALRERCPYKDRLIPVLLERNIETVVDAVLRIQGAPARTRKPRPLGRDLILTKMAYAEGAGARRELLGLVPSLAYLIRRLAAHVR